MSTTGGGVASCGVQNSTMRANDAGSAIASSTEGRPSRRWILLLWKGCSTTMSPLSWELARISPGHARAGSAVAAVAHVRLHDVYSVAWLGSEGAQQGVVTAQLLPTAIGLAPALVLAGQPAGPAA